MPNKATLIGSVALVLWGLLALFTTATKGIPPYQLLALTFAVASVLSVSTIRAQGRAVTQSWRQGWSVWALGVGGLFGYHLFYFIALANAPALNASMIAYLWPLLIVLSSALLPGERVRWYHVCGGLMGLAGTFVLLGGDLSNFSGEYRVGYLAALACAFTWTAYSVLNRAFKAVPTDIVAGFCLGTALLAIICHLLLESWVSPTLGQWAAILALGAGPVGAAFFLWDYGVKHGNIQLLGTLSYGTPLLSALVLIGTGKAEASLAVLGACVLIVAAATLASGFWREQT